MEQLTASPTPPVTDAWAEAQYPPEALAEGQTEAGAGAAPAAQTQAEAPAQAEADIVAHQAETTIEASTDYYGGGGDGSSTYSSFAASTGSTSLSSSIRNFAFEHGRRYHNYPHVTYQFPNDESEQDREDMKHAMVVNLCGGRLHYAPLENPQNILDVGTGTGIWAVDMGDEYPSASISGIDLSPIQPQWVPPNVKFVVDDAESPWTSVGSQFDFVHIRHMTSSIKDFPKLCAQAYEHTKPGGWIEIQELHFKIRCDDSSMTEDYVVAQWLELVRQGLAAFGVDLLAATKHAGNLRETGFINVQERVFKVPIGTWARNKTLKIIGLYLRTVIFDGVQAVSLGPLTRGLGWTQEQVEGLLVSLRRSLMDSSVHSYLPFHVVYGQKPLTEH